MSKKKLLIVVVVVALLAWWLWPQSPAQDEAMARGIPLEFFDQAEDEADYFHAADGGIPLTPAEVRGRNTWWIWTGGNEAFWDYLANNSFGTFDLLKTLSSYPCSPEQKQRASAYEAELASGASSDGTYGAGAYGSGGYAAPPGHRYAGTDESSETHGQGYACAKTMYPAAGKAPYRYYNRDSRFCFQGLINEPGFEKPQEPDEWGLCLDKRTANAEPFDQEVYGRASGTLGLRIYPNPNFFEGKKAKEHQQRWKKAMKEDAFYLDPKFFSDLNLVRPYRVGMSCGFCHISPHPNHPPADPENPEMANLSGTIGAQYFWFGRVFGPNVTPDNFVWHMLDSQRPGAVDTSFIPADNLNNPRAMNAVFNLEARLGVGTKLGYETSSGGALDLPEVQEKGPSFGVPHVLWDGADSVGINAALTRVYINIGEYHQQWVRHIDPILGLKKQSPIRVKDAQENSTYWNATQKRAYDMAAYLIRAGQPMPLAKSYDNAAGGDDSGESTEPAAEGASASAAGDGAQDAATPGDDEAVYARGQVVFAENCAHCHSSKLPDDIVGLNEQGCIGDNYLECWKRFWQHVQTPAFKQQMTAMVQQDDFLDDNFLSTDARVPMYQPLIEWQPQEPITGSVREQYLERARQRGLMTGALETEICSPIATNAIAGHVWDNFSSKSYKSLPGVGEVELYDPVADTTFKWMTHGGGRGYMRVPSLVSVWSTAPFLHNNEIGTFTGDPSVEGRLAAFNDAIRKMLWPELRPGTIHRTDRVTSLKISPSALPRFVRLALPLRGLFGLGFLVEDEMIQVGPIPGPVVEGGKQIRAGTPVNFVANLNAARQDADFGLLGLGRTVLAATKKFKTIHQDNLDDKEASDLLREIVPDLMKKSACPDFIVDRGHYFGTDLSDDDKNALIEYVKSL